MSTNSFIGIKTSEGISEVIYCHFDGYPSHHLPILSKHYGTIEKVKELLSFGDISVLETTIEKSIFYCRDKGEKMRKPELIAIGLAGKSYIEYVYLFDGEKWVYNKR